LAACGIGLAGWYLVEFHGMEVGRWIEQRRDVIGMVSLPVIAVVASVVRRLEERTERISKSTGLDLSGLLYRARFGGGPTASST
jgi:hypothetical protein